MSRWERQLEEEADDMRDILDKRATAEGDSDFTNIATGFIAWRVLLLAGVVVAGVAGLLILIIWRLLVAP